MGWAEGFIGEPSRGVGESQDEKQMFANELAEK
jgi:hypothetical protein